MCFRDAFACEAGKQTSWSVLVILGVVVIFRMQGVVYKPEHPVGNVCIHSLHIIYQTTVIILGPLCETPAFSKSVVF